MWMTVTPSAISRPVSKTATVLVRISLPRIPPNRSRWTVDFRVTDPEPGEKTLSP